MAQRLLDAVRAAGGEREANGAAGRGAVPPGRRRRRGAAGCGRRGPARGQARRGAADLGLLGRAAHVQLHDWARAPRWSASRAGRAWRWRYSRSSISRPAAPHAFEALARFAIRGGEGPLHWFSLADELGMRAELELACLDAALELMPTPPRGHAPEREPLRADAHRPPCRAALRRSGRSLPADRRGHRGDAGAPRLGRRAHGGRAARARHAGGRRRHRRRLLGPGPAGRPAARLPQARPRPGARHRPATRRAHRWCGCSWTTRAAPAACWWPRAWRPPPSWPRCAWRAPRSCRATCWAAGQAVAGGGRGAALRAAASPPMTR